MQQRKHRVSPMSQKDGDQTTSTTRAWQPMVLREWPTKSNTGRPGAEVPIFPVRVNYVRTVKYNIACSDLKGFVTIFEKSMQFEKSVKMNFSPTSNGWVFFTCPFKKGTLPFLPHCERRKVVPEQLMADGRTKSTQYCGNFPCDASTSLRTSHFGLWFIYHSCWHRQYNRLDR